MTDRNKAVPASYLILRRGNDVLLMRRANTGYMDGLYGLPSGHVEAGELPSEALVREAKEEIGIDLDRSTIKLVHTLYRLKHDETGDRADYFFEATSDQEPQNLEPHKCDELRWTPLDALPDQTIPYLQEIFAAIARGDRYSEMRK